MQDNTSHLHFPGKIKDTINTQVIHIKIKNKYIFWRELRVALTDLVTLEKIGW